MRAYFSTLKGCSGNDSILLGIPNKFIDFPIRKASRLWEAWFQKGNELLRAENFAVLLSKAHHLASEGVFVVVPRGDFDESDITSGDDHGKGGIEDGAFGPAEDVGGNDFFIVVAKDALEFAVGGVFDGGVDLIGGGVFLQEKGAVADGAIGDRNADGVAVELAIEFGDDFADGLSSAGGGRDDVGGTGAGAADVAASKVEDALIVGISVDGGHGAADNAKFVVENFHHRGEAVGGAASAGDDGLISGEFIAVDAIDIGRNVFGRRRGRDDNAFGTILHVDVAVLVALQAASALQDNVDAIVFPSEIVGIFLAKNRDLVAIEDDAVVFAGDEVFVPGAVGGVVLKKISKGGGVDEVVNRDNFEDVFAGFLVHFIGAAERETTDAAESVDCKFDGHVS